MNRKLDKTIRRIAIVGGGFCGTLVAIHLLRNRSLEWSEIVLIERAARPLGTAFGTEWAEHLLNVPAANMSAFPDRSTDFVEWLASNDQARGLEFVPRRLYGRYLAQRLSDARGRAKLREVAGEAIALRELSGKLFLKLDDGMEIEADRVVLALGAPPPRTPHQSLAGLSAAIYRDNPWLPEVFERIEGLNELTLIGSGLTAVDVVCEAERRGFRGRYTLLSRRGLLPRPHIRPAAPPAECQLEPGMHLPELTARLRAAIARCSSEAEVNAQIDALRPRTQQIWRALPLTQKRRFLRHLKPYWEAARHRMPPALDQVLSTLRAAGRLRVLAGRISSGRGIGGEAELQIVIKGGREGCVIRADRIVNCTGPALDYLQSPLMSSLVGAGLGRPDECGVGLACTPEGGLLGVSGASRAIFTLGSSRRGELWESSAVPELRAQAEIVAQAIAEHDSVQELQLSEAVGS